jgi:hypothetical protein
MINLQVQITGGDDLINELAGVADQVPFATSVAINNTLNDIQRDVRTHVHSTFIMRAQDFIDRTIYIGPLDRAKKDRLTGTIRINPDRDFLAKFEDGGEKTPQGSASLGVPIVRQGSPALIIGRSDPLSLRALFADLQKQGVAEGRIGKRRGAPKRLVQQKVFLITGRDGKTLLVKRDGGVTTVLWVFEKEVPIKADLDFVEIAMNTALEVWEQNASDALDMAIETMR